MAIGHVSYSEARAEDLDELIEIRIAAMRESLERIGRFDPARARARLVDSFDPAITRSIDLDGERVGFFTWRRREDGFFVDHLYVSPGHQGKGIGSVVMAHLIELASGESIRLGALRDSDSNRFYLRHGFRVERVEEFDNYLVYP